MKVFHSLHLLHGKVFSSFSFLFFPPQVDLLGRGSHMRQICTCKEMLGHGRRKIWLSCFCPLGVGSNLFTKLPKDFFSFLVSCFVEFFVVCLVLVGRLFYLVGGFWVGFLWGVVSPVQKTSEFCISYYQCYQKVSKKTLYGMQWREGWSDSFYTNDTACGQSSIILQASSPKLSLDYTKLHNLCIQLPFLFQGLRM